MPLARALAVAIAGLMGTPSAQAAEPAYEIGGGDVLQVVVLGQEGLSGDFTVGRDGMLAFPFLGKLKAEGWSAEELGRKLTTLLADGYLKQPRVSVSVKEYRSKPVYVTGEVRKPGAYGLRPDRSLRSLLKDVGELTAEVGHEVVVVRPPAAPAGGQGDGGGDTTEASPAPGRLPGEVPGAEVFRLSLRDVQSGYPDKDLLLQVGDTVYFPKAAQVYVTGHVARPGGYRYEEGMTVFQALALAGSVTERGSEKGVRIKRLVDGKKKELKPELSDLVQPEDVIHVPERFF